MIEVTKTAPESLKMLWKDKVFIKARDYQSIEQALEKRGYNFTDKNLMMALGSSRFLTRRGNRRNYKYTQKYPFVEESKNEKQRRNK